MKHYLNVCDVNGAEVDPVDVVTFGSPCQDLSVAGLRKGLKHESNGDDETTRSGLFMEAVRIIKEMRKEDELRQLRSGRSDGHIRPRFAVWENVPGAFSSNKGDDFRVVLEELARIKEAEISIPMPEKGKWKTAGEIVGDGWSIAWRTLDAQYHGVPQRRRRIFLVADFAGECAGEILFECNGLPGYSSQSSEKGQGTSGNTSESTGRSGEGNGLTAAQTQTLFQPIAFEPGLAKRDGSENRFVVNCSPTIRANMGDNQTAVVCVQGSMIGRKDENGPQGDGINVDKSFTLNTIDRHAVAYGICSLSSNSMKSDNPHSEIYEATTSKTLDLNGGNSACNQGGICICEPIIDGVIDIETEVYVRKYEVDCNLLCECLRKHKEASNVSNKDISEALDVPITKVEHWFRQDKSFAIPDAEVWFRLKELLGIQTDEFDEEITTFIAQPGKYDMSNRIYVGNTSPTLTTQSSDYKYLLPISIENHPNDSRIGICEDGTVQSLTGRMGTGGGNVPLIAEPWTYQKTTGPLMANTHPGSYSGQDAYTDMFITQPTFAIKDEGFMDFSEEVAATLKARDYKMPQAVCYYEFIKWIVRRLTPTECARLQGMPDDWCRLSQIEDMSDEDFEFWTEAHKTYAEINGKTYKAKTKKQMIAWYNKLQVDGAEYKAYGNGMALPCVRVPIHGIAQHGAKTMASLFDGIGGFPLAGLIDGIETLWTSEIELFPIAVTMERFCEYEKYGCFTFGYEVSDEALQIKKEKKEMELRVENYQLPERIGFNYEELKNELTERVSFYETLVYTDDQVKEAKNDRANLNKLKKALNDERIRMEKEYMVPFNDFKVKVNEIISIIDKPVSVIDKQVKAYEDKQKQDKADAITSYFNGTEHPEWLHLSQILDEKWLNASVSMKSVQDAIDARLNQIEIDLTTLHSLPEFGFEATQVYISTLDMNKAISEGHRLSEIQKKKAEYEAEQARLKAEIESREAEFKNDQKVSEPVAEVAVTAEAPAKKWVAFQALLSTEDALALKAFFESRHIEFKAVR